MSSSFLNWLKHLPWLCLSALPAAALYGFLFPWPAADQVFSRYPDQTPIVISFSSGSKSTRYAGGDWVTTKHETRSYVLLPSLFTDPKIITVAQVNDNAPVVSESSALLPLVSFAVMIGLALIGVWYFWFRTTREYRVDPDKIRAIYDRSSANADSGAKI